MNWMLWLILAPLVPGFVWCVWALSRERDLRLALVVCFLAALVGRQFVGDPPAVEDLGQFPFGQNSAPLLADFATHLLACLVAIAIGRSVVERNRAERVHWEGMEALRSLATFFNAPPQPFDQALDELLSLGCRHLRMDVGLLSRVEGDRYDILALHSAKTLPVSRGERLPLDETFCALTLQRDQIMAIENTAASRWKQHPGSARFGFGSYFGVPIRRGATPFGTLCFAGTDARKRFSGTDKQLLGLLAHWVDNAMATRETQRDMDDRARRQQVCVELSQRALRREEPNLLSESVARIASALDTPFAAVLQTAAISQGEDGVEVLIAACTGWDQGTLGTTVQVAKSFLGDVLLEGETVVVEDFALHAREVRPAFFQPHPIIAAACVPIPGAERQLGVLCVCAAEARSFGADELDFLRLGANLLASTLATGTVENEARVQRRDGRDQPEDPAAQEPRAAARPKHVAQRSSSSRDRRRLSVDASIRTLEEDLREGAGLQLSLDLAAPTSEFRMFRYEFERILWGLVLRAADLANGDGELRVETRLLAPGGAGATPEPFVTLAVRATSATLDSAAMSDLLDRDEAGIRPNSGGLPTATRRLSLPRIRRLVATMGGDISAHSGERDGTALIVYLPALPARSERDAPQRPAPTASSFATG